MNSTHRPRRSRGLTLVELMVVVVVAGVLITLALPSFTDMIARQRVRGVNAELVTDLQFARSQSVPEGGQGAGVHIYFRKTDGVVTCYSIYVAADVGGCDCLKEAGPDRCIVPGKEVKTVRILDSEGLLVTSRPARITLTGVRTSASNDLTVEVRSKRSSGGHLRTSLSRAGQVSVCSPDRSIGGVPECPES